MDDGCLWEIFERTIFAVFKRRPNVAFAISVTIIVGFLTIWILNATNPDDRAYPVIGLIFVLLVVMGRIVQFIVQNILGRRQPQEEDLLDEEAPGRAEPTPVEQDALEHPPVIEIMPVVQNPPLQPEIQPAVIENISPQPVKKEQQKFSYYSLNGSDALQILLICIVCMSLGYLFAYLFGLTETFAFGEKFVPGWDESTNEYYHETMDTPIPHFICGLPLTFCISAPFFATLFVVFGYLLKNRNGLIKLITGIFSFFLGFIVFIPVQVVVLIGISF